MATMERRRLIQMASDFGVRPADMTSVLKSHSAIRLDDSWSNVRSDRNLLIDLLYLYGKRSGSKITVQKAFEVTQGMYGKGTRPTPSKWLESHGHLVV